MFINYKLINYYSLDYFIFAYLSKFIPFNNFNKTNKTKKNLYLFADTHSKYAFRFSSFFFFKVESNAYKFFSKVCFNRYMHTYIYDVNGNCEQS